MSTICLVACASRKKDGPRIAEQLYDSALFDGSRTYALSRCDDWYVLSAKHGLTSPNLILAPYNESLVGANAAMRQSWASLVFSQLTARIASTDRVVFLAGKQYRQFLEPYLAARGNDIAAPLANLGIGRQVAWLQKLVREKQRLADLDHLYQLLDRLASVVGGRRPLGQTSSKSVWPARGLYFFFEEGEFRMSSPFQRRIVRVGTHSVSEGSKTTLWHRLRTHRGGIDLSGNHRGSIFRLHVGNALIQKHSVDAIFPDWGIGQSANQRIREAEKELERLVSEHIGRMSVLWLAIGDQPGPRSDRAYLERNIIGLLCGPSGPLDFGSNKWLGNDSPRPEMSESGLWNLNYLGVQYDPRMLNVLEHYVQVTAGYRADKGVSVAPKDWHLPSLLAVKGQRTLF